MGTPLLTCIKQLPRILPRIEIPVLILQSDKEKIVNNKNLQKLTALLSQGQIQHVLNAKHEVLFEQDNVREQALQIIFAFFAQKS